MNSIFTLTSIAIYRWIVACGKQLELTSGQTVNLLVGAGWLWSLALAAPPLLGWGVYLPESNGMR